MEAEEVRAMSAIPPRREPPPEPPLHDVNPPDRHEAGRHRPPAEGGDPEPEGEPFYEGDGEEPAEGAP